MPNLRRSRWVHEYEEPGNDAATLFHTERMEVLHVDGEVRDLLRAFETSSTIDEVAARFADPAAAEAAARYLAGLGFLVPAERDEVLERIKRRAASIDRQGVGKVATLRILLTENCNLRCTYCFEEHVNKHMSLETLIRVLDETIETTGPERTIAIQWFGGEPLLRFDLMKEGVEHIGQAIRERRLGGVAYVLTTNGTLVTAESAAFLARHKFEISVSVDGKKEVNDLKRIDIRGRGTFDRAIEGYRKLKEFGVPSVGFLLTAVPSTVGHIAEFMEYAIAELDTSFFAINTPQPSMAGWGVDGDEFVRQCVRCQELSEVHGVPFSSPLSKVLIGLGGKKPTLSSCFNPQGDRCASVTINGELSPCIVSWEKEFLHPLSQLNRPNMFLTEAYEDQQERCLPCSALNTCGGPCHLESMYMARGGVWDDDRCRFFKRGMAWAVRRMNGGAPRGES